MQELMSHMSISYLNMYEEIQIAKTMVLSHILPQNLINNQSPFIIEVKYSIKLAA
ncbi:hypothetical protein ACE6H2_000556 [Prunus campanulata]